MANRYQRRHGNNPALEQAKLNQHIQQQMGQALGFGIEYMRHVSIAIIDAVLREFEASKEALTEEVIFDIMNQITTILKGAKGDKEIYETLKTLEKEYNIKLNLEKVAEYNPAINGYLKSDDEEKDEDSK